MHLNTYAEPTLSLFSHPVLTIKAEGIAQLRCVGAPPLQVSDRTTSSIAVTWEDAETEFYEIDGAVSRIGLLLLLMLECATLGFVVVWKSPKDKFKVRVTVGPSERSFQACSPHVIVGLVLCDLCGSMFHTLIGSCELPSQSVRLWLNSFSGFALI